MNTPHKCPVCEGSGKVPARLYDPCDARPGAVTVCCPCNGKGVVWHKERDTFRGVDIQLENGVNVQLDEYGRTTTMDGFPA